MQYDILDGPPFINTPNVHFGHLLVSTIKDTISRYMTKKGYIIVNKLSFDCHGMPIEQEAIKIVGNISPTDSIDKIKLFNDECRNIIAINTEKWYIAFDKLGRKFDRTLTYNTSDFKYMQCIWYYFKQLYDDGLIYKAKKVMPYSPQLQSVLSNFEAQSNYQDRTDISVYVKFKLADIDEYLLIWTTTPWSLFGNQGICINPNLNYKLILYHDDKIWICENCIKFKDYTIIKTINGKELIGLKYIPLFKLKDYDNYQVYSDTYVDDKTGTGLVHLAKFFGADDMRVMQSEKYLPEYLVDSQVKFTINHDDININGKFVMDTSEDIVIYLKKNNIAIMSEKIKHSYPYCWRTDHPLIYLASDAWFLNVQKILPELIENNNKIIWYPKYVGTERFGNWLKEAKDWCISRNRVWGTPIPIWVSNKNNMICIGTVEELEKYTGKKYDDLHLDALDDTSFTFNGETYQRISFVFDCWLESGLAGLARHGYPECINKSYPVDFITESVDQTRGWFYTLNVLSTALNHQPAFKKVLVSGLILAADGKKMSKRLNNYTSPLILMEKYNPDIIRLYLIGSPAAKAESFNFKEEDLNEIHKKILLYNNAHNLFNDYKKVYNNLEYVESNYILDIWIKHLFYDTQNRINKHMDNLELHLIPNIIFKYIDYICNSYIKLNRNRFKTNIESLLTLYFILYNTNILFEPFMPHIIENLKLDNIIINKNDDFDIDYDILNKFNLITLILEDVRKLRQTINKPLFYPLNNIDIYVDSNNIINYYDILCKELNIKTINMYTTQPIQKKYKPNKPLLGKIYKNDAIKYIKLIENNAIDNINNDYYHIELIIENKENMIVSKFNYNNNEGLIYLNICTNNLNDQEAELNNIRRIINDKKKELNIKIYNKTEILFENNDFWKKLNIELLSNFKLNNNIKLIDNLIDYNIITTFNNNEIKYKIIY
jgi:isoleucyl-tRNA synthetase